METSLPSVILLLEIRSMGASQALAFAEIMREHTLESTGGLTYSQMGRYQN